MTDPVKHLDSALSQLTKDEDKISTLLSFLKSKDDRGTIDLNSSGKNSNPVFETKKSMRVSKVMGLVQKHGLNEKFKSVLISQTNMPEPQAMSPLDHLECGDWNVNTGRRCMKVTGKGWNKGMIFGMGRSLWGNMPALDVLNLKDNEGISQAANDQA
ncbi:hypothetical protein K435DRAFT_811347 [Dendrothele bispora CBS 962.96]|uniref:Uncharacterized protein n=1 Tax=Dendrothele bispora (strain CBS 962.96) TaxID=1314807 RepID=A0A4S8KS96_DENBC|nr:hypothetical protein K435DRAFT_811347 [Dendrothele bispora CBS 962.96]